MWSVSMWTREQVPSPLRDPELSELPSALRGIRAIPLNSLWLSFPEVDLFLGGWGGRGSLQVKNFK